MERLVAGSAAEAMLPVEQGLAAARQSANLSAKAEARLLIVVDQFEELFTLPIPRRRGQPSSMRSTNLRDARSRG